MPPSQFLSWYNQDGYTEFIQPEGAFEDRYFPFEPVMGWQIDYYTNLDGSHRNGYIRPDWVTEQMDKGHYAYLDTHKDAHQNADYIFRIDFPTNFTEVRDRREYEPVNVYIYLRPQDNYMTDYEGESVSDLMECLTRRIHTWYAVGSYGFGNNDQRIHPSADTANHRMNIYPSPYGWGGIDYGGLLDENWEDLQTEYTMVRHAVGAEKRSKDLYQHITWGGILAPPFQHELWQGNPDEQPHTKLNDIVAGGLEAWVVYEMKWIGFIETPRQSVHPQIWPNPSATARQVPRNLPVPDYSYSYNFWHLDQFQF